MRLCVDYRGLNKITIKNRYPLPLVSEMLDRLSRAKIFTKLDLRDAYHRLRIKEGDEWKTAFKTRYGHFEYCVLPFGLANAPATFQSYIHRALGGLVDRTCVVYLDDILIYSEDEDQHEQHVREVLERLDEWGLYAKASKCTFNTKQVEFLGYIVTPTGVIMDPVRVQTIQEWPEPESYRDVQVFLGFANFYRRFIHNYSDVARHLSDHMAEASRNPTQEKNSKAARKKTKKGPTKWYKPWSWPEHVQGAFRELRAKFTEAPLLRHFDPDQPLMVITDASNFALAGILLQPDRDPDATQLHWRPVAFYSRKFQGPEIRYHTHDKELLAIVDCFKQWRHYLEHASHTTRVLSDHHNLRYFMTTKELTPRQARWAEELARFDFEIEYKPGENNPADGPSRRPDYAKGFKTGDGKQMIDILLPTLQNKLRVWAARAPTAPCTESQAVQTPSAPCGAPAGTRTVADEGPNMPEQDVPDTSSEPGDTPPLIAELSSQTNSEDIEQLELGALQRPKDFNLVAAFLTHAHRVVARSMVPSSLVLGAVQDETAFTREPSETLTDLIREVQRRDASYAIFNAEVDRKHDGKEAARHQHWELDPMGLLRRNGKVWVPHEANLRQKLLMKNHDDPLGGHYGLAKTVELLLRKYYWPRLKQEAKEYISHCEKCQVYKIRRHKPWGLLESVPPASEPWRHYAMDFITDLPPSKDEQGQTYDSVLVLIDRFSKYVQYLPVNKTINAQMLANLIKEKCFLKVDQPHSIITDRGSAFTSQYWSDLCFYLKIDHRYSTAFHPQTDGQTERQNQELESYLRMYLNYQQDNWCELLPYAEYAYNSKQHSSHKYTPIQIAYGIRPSGFDGVHDDHWLKSHDQLWNPTGKSEEIHRRVQGHLKAWAEQWELAKQSLQNAQEQQRLWYNRKHQDKHFKVGDEVLLRSTNIKTRRPSKKLDARYLGPFQIKERIGKLAYRLQLPPSMARIHPVFHVNLLEPWHKPPPEKNFRPGPIEHPEVVGERYEVEAILRHKSVKNELHYEVKWLGWPAEDSTWEPADYLDNCEYLLKEYWDQSPQSANRRKRSDTTVSSQPMKKTRGRLKAPKSKE